LAFFGVLSAWLAGLGMAVSSLIVVANALRLTNFSAPTATSPLAPPLVLNPAKVQ
jgi:Cu2+-exporting ATPase